jgi:predicted small lipoprotein YifL
MYRPLLVLLTASLLCACGQKGNLYLPGSEREAVDTATPQASPATGAAATAAPAPAAPAAAGATPAPTTAEERERRNAARTNRN